ncbi:putative U3 small nucleolar RNA-associated protein 6 [Paratrimastix pyriformis]|uniref:U3 small nucleolar RNA-associated protein 6 n=1 Tax=Paratrimastix pyriformis TaxID=342808 RepID=A0ABQ8USW3_9EUKA|nr:putative U3 small nucleolar RNA-associated protein 6 [Paratrimastix pyriformis]
MSLYAVSLLEDTIPELQEYRKKGIFTKDEIKTVLKKREHFESKITKGTSGKTRDDFAHYIDFETKLGELRTKRKLRLGIRKRFLKADQIAIRRLHFIYTRALQRFGKTDVGLWMSYADFCTQTKSFRMLSRALARALQFHPNYEAFWVLTAILSLNMARALPMPAVCIRKHPTSGRLFREFYRMELMYYAKKLEERLRITDEEVALLQAAGVHTHDELISAPTVPMVIYRNAVKVLLAGDYTLRLPFLRYALDKLAALRAHAAEQRRLKQQAEQKAAAGEKTKTKKEAGAAKDPEPVAFNERVYEEAMGSLTAHAQAILWQMVVDCWPAAAASEADEPLVNLVEALCAHGFRTSPPLAGYRPGELKARLGGQETIPGEPLPADQAEAACWREAAQLSGRPAVWQAMLRRLHAPLEAPAMPAPERLPRLTVLEDALRAALAALPATARPAAGATRVTRADLVALWHGWIEEEAARVADQDPATRQQVARWAAECAALATRILAEAPSCWALWRVRLQQAAAAAAAAATGVPANKKRSMAAMQAEEPPPENSDAHPFCCFVLVAVVLVAVVLVAVVLVAVVLVAVVLVAVVLVAVVLVAVVLVAVPPFPVVALVREAFSSLTSEAQAPASQAYRNLGTPEAAAAAASSGVPQSAALVGWRYVLGLAIERSWVSRSSVGPLFELLKTLLARVNAPLSVSLRVATIEWALRSPLSSRAIRSLIAKLVALPPLSPDLFNSALQAEHTLAQTARSVALAQAAAALNPALGPVATALGAQAGEAEVEDDEAAAHLERTRQLFEQAVHHFGAADPDLWLSYIRFEIEEAANLGNATQLAWRAQRTLAAPLSGAVHKATAQVSQNTAELVRRFVEGYQRLTAHGGAATTAEDTTLAAPRFVPFSWTPAPAAPAPPSAAARTAATKKADALFVISTDAMSTSELTDLTAHTPTKKAKKVIGKSTPQRKPKAARGQPQKLRMGQKNGKEILRRNQKKRPTQKKEKKSGKAK